MQCVAVCGSVLHCMAVCGSVWQCVAVCGSVLQYAAVCCSVSHFFGGSGIAFAANSEIDTVFNCDACALCCSVLQCVAVRYSVLQCGSLCCRVLQCVAILQRLLYYLCGTFGNGLGIRLRC